MNLQSSILENAQTLGLKLDKKDQFLSIVGKYEDDEQRLNLINEILKAEKSKTFFEDGHLQKTAEKKSLINVDMTKDMCTLFSLIYPAKDFGHESKYLSSLQTEEQTLKAVKDLNNYGYHVLPIRLESSVVENIKSSLGKCNFHMRNKFGQIKGYNETNVDRTNSVTAWISEQHDLNIIPAVQHIVFDPYILNVASRYFESTPIHVQSNCWWTKKYTSTHHSLSTNAQLFHQDREFIRFLKVFIYLNDVTEQNGAHVYVKGSHKSKLLEERGEYNYSQRLTDEDVRTTFGKDNVISMTGKAGTIILEDTIGVHKGVPVQEGHRLLLQIEYANSLYFNPVPSFGDHGILNDYQELKKSTARLFSNYDAQRHKIDTKKHKQKRAKKIIKGAIKNRIATLIKR